MENKNNDVDVNIESQNDSNDIIIKCENEKKQYRDFSRRFKILLIIGIITTMIAPLALIGWIADYQNQIARSGVSMYLVNVTYFLKLSVCFIGMIIIKITKKPFPKVLMYCTLILGIILTVISFFMFLVPGYTTGYLLISNGKGFFIDGNYLSQGVIMIIISKLIKYGFDYQTNEEETI